jgi:hypothetical protein
METARLVDTEADAGQLLPVDRALAAAQALPLLATYFADAPSWALAAQPQLAEADPGTEELAGFLRMRVALAAMARLEPILSRIIDRPSFFYAREAEDSVGSLRGTLDIPRFTRSRLRPESPRRYPVKVINRRYATPENVAACYAVLWMSSELAVAPLRAIPEGAPEYRAVLDARSRLAAWMRQPVLVHCRVKALEVRRRRILPKLLDTMRQRLSSGRIMAPDRYERLVQWIEAAERIQAGAEAGPIEWSFYDDRFDTKLFEIWSLGRLITALEQTLGPPSQAASSLLERARSPIRTWQFGSARLQLYFQPSLARLTKEPARWMFVEPHNEPLTGFPDIGVTVTPVIGLPFAILADPKLRRRRSAPTEELYKMLGYFGNMAQSSALGTIIFYSPGDPRTYRLEAKPAGELLALGIDPSNAEATSAAFATIAQQARDAAGIDQDVVRLLAAAAQAGEASQEATTTIRQNAAVTAMLTAAEALPEASLAPVRKSTSATLSAIWDRLSTDTATMLVTAEFFGVTAPSDADHSGPLLGLAAVCERVLFENVLADPMRSRPELFPADATFGTFIRWLADACRSHPHEPQGTSLRARLARSPAMNTEALAALIGDLRRLNSQYRIPAAHRDFVVQSLWAEGRSLVLDPTQGILTRLVQATTLGHLASQP